MEETQRESGAITTIGDLLADLEAKATEVAAAQDERSIAQQRQLWAIDAFRGACSPDRILALVAYVRKQKELVEAAIEFVRASQEVMMRAQTMLPNAATSDDYAEPMTTFARHAPDSRLGKFSQAMLDAMCMACKRKFIDHTDAQLDECERMENRWNGAINRLTWLAGHLDAEEKA